MLVLSRRTNQRLKLGETIVLTVLQVTGDRVRLGIEAPTEIRVLREELEPIVADDGPVSAPAA